MVYTEIRVPRKFRCLKHDVSRLGTRCSKPWSKMFRTLVFLRPRGIAVSSTLQDDLLQHLENHPSPISMKILAPLGKYSHLDLRFGRFVTHGSETPRKPYANLFDSVTEDYTKGAVSKFWDCAFFVDYLIDVTSSAGADGLSRGRGCRIRTPRWEHRHSCRHGVRRR